MKIHMNSRGQKILQTLFYVVLIILLIALFFKLTIIFLPIVIAFFLSSLIEPIVAFISRKTKLNRSLSTLLTILIGLSTVGVGLFFLISKLVSEIILLSQTLQKNYDFIENTIKFQTDRIQSMYKGLPPEATDSIKNIASKLGTYVINVLESFASTILNTAISIPSMIVFIVVTILATYFITSDKAKIHNFIHEQLPTKWYNKISVLLGHTFDAITQYVKAQLIIMSIITTMLAIGFTIIGVDYSILVAVATGFVDALPLFGVGSVLIPWIIYQLIFGSFKMAISLLIIYILAVVMRQILEPKVFGKQMGVHPLLALSAMYVGFNYFGILGLILSPIIIMIVKNILNDAIVNKSLRKLFEDEN